MEMKQYIGTNIIKAQPMNRLAYNVYRGWELPEDEDGSDEGFLVDSNSLNQTKGDHIKWLPKEIFEEEYKQSGEMSFGGAIEMARRGFKI